MDNLALKIINEMASEDEVFVIDNDNLAEWALRKISEERADAQRLINVCDTAIAEYAMKKEEYQEQLRSKTSYLEYQLQNYFATVPHKETKTQETYKLPSGTLKLKKQVTEYIRDEEVFKTWLIDNGYKEDYVETVQKPKWGEFKKVISVSGDKAVTELGEIIDGITVQYGPPVFEVDI